MKGNLKCLLAALVLSILTCSLWIGASDTAHASSKARKSGEASANYRKTVAMYKKKGSYSIRKPIRGSVLISSPGVRLRNATVLGNLTIGSRASRGSVYLDNVSVKGRIIIDGCSSTTAWLRDTKAGGITVRRNCRNVTIRTKGKSISGTVTMESGCRLEEVGKTGKDNGFGNAVVSKSARGGSEIVLSGGFARLDVKAARTCVKVAKGSVRTMAVHGSASGTSIDVSPAGRISKLNLRASASIKGKGAIGSSLISGDNTSLKIGANSRVGRLSIGSLSLNTVVDMSKGAAVSTLEVVSNVFVKGSGSIGRVDVIASCVPLTLAGTTKAGTLKVIRTADDATVTIAEGCAVNHLVLDTRATVIGGGRVEKATINFPGSVIGVLVERTVKNDPEAASDDKKDEMMGSGQGKPGPDGNEAGVTGGGPDASGDDDLVYADDVIVMVPDSDEYESGDGGTTGAIGDGPDDGTNPSPDVPDNGSGSSDNTDVDDEEPSPDGNATQDGGSQPDPVDVSFAQLSAAVDSADSAAQSVKVSADGRDVYSTFRWVTQATMDEFMGEVAVARGVLGNSGATQGEVDGAVESLAEAKAAFDGGTYDGLRGVKTALSEAIIIATSNLTSVEYTSIDGTDVPVGKTWVTDIAMTEYNNAIVASRKIAIKSDATQQEVDAAVAALEAATAAFDSAKGVGSGQ